MNSNNPSKFNPSIIVSAILTIALAWTLFSLYHLTTKTSRLGSTQPQKMWYAVEHVETKLVVDKKDAESLWKLVHNLSIPCWRLAYDTDRTSCLDDAKSTAKSILATKHETYQFRVCTPGTFGENCTRLRPYTTEHIKIFDSLVAIQDQYWVK